MQRTLPQMLIARAARPDDGALVTCGGQSWTGRDALALAGGRGASLLAAGIARGDRVATLCSNSPELLEVVLGCGWIGAVLVPINTAAMEPQIEYYLRNSGARLLVIDANLLDRLGTLALTLPLDRVWVVGGWSGHPDRKAEPMPDRLECVPCATVLPGDPFAILYTSGTTGPSKGVVSPHAQYYWWGALSAGFLEITQDDVLCTTLPLFHVNALNTLAQALLTGAHMVSLARFSASSFWDSMAAQGATVIYLLGAMVPILLSRAPTPQERTHRIRRSLSPGVPADLLAELTGRTGICVVDGFGSTETNFVIGEKAGDRKPGRMGRIHDRFEASVVDEHDNPLPAGTPGELVVRSREPFAMASGYHGMPDKTIEAWRNLWFHTGDRVVQDGDGQFRFVDRLKDSIRRRGENISSYEVEQVLLSHPAIAATAVYPVPSDLAEDEVMAAIVLRDGMPLDPAAMVAFCAARMPRFAIPRYIEFLNTLPQTENGKVQKFILRARGVGEATHDLAPQIHGVRPLLRR